jgi:3-hydroxyisobutyrate dehydrogenase-like beta-hydroxyacid dehydrogenase
VFQAMTQNLVEKGGLEHPIVLYNRTSARAEEHSAHIGHSVVALSIEEAITKADIIWSCVQNQDAVAEIFDKATNLDIRGKLFVECSTILPDVTTKISEKVLAAGGEFIAMPG